MQMEGCFTHGEHTHSAVANTTNFVAWLGLGSFLPQCREELTDMRKPLLSFHTRHTKIECSKKMSAT